MRTGLLPGWDYRVNEGWSEEARIGRKHNLTMPWWDCFHKLHWRADFTVQQYGKNERNREIIELREDGLTLAAIGGRYGISRARVSQIVKKWDGQSLWALRRQAEDIYEPWIRWQKVLASDRRDVWVGNNWDDIDDDLRST